jgi:flagellar hook-associated protein 3 FlgL
MTRISNIAQHNLTISQIFETQSRLQRAQIQLSTGMKSQNYSGIANDSQRLVNLESSRALSDQFVTNNRIVTLRLQTMELSVSNIFEAASKLKTILVNGLNGSNASEFSLNLEADNLLQEVAKQLNVKIGDRFLFAGTITDTAPVDLTAAGYGAPPTSYPSNADTGYFQGDGTRIKVRAADDFDVTYGATADEAGFEKIIRALQLAKTATTSPTIDTLRLQEALTIVNQAINDIPNIRSRIGASLNALDKADVGHRDMLLFVEETISDIENVDIPATVARMTMDQVLLEASFLTISRLRDLSLTNFLR